jgi:DNA primase
MNKPSILSVIQPRVELRKAGKEYNGLCPFHSEKTPSFTVNEEKGLFHCFGCGESGDVIDFVMKLDSVTFPEARAQLGIASTRPSPKAPDPVKDTAALIAHWANTQTDRANSMLRDVGQQARLARELHRTDEINRLGREWISWKPLPTICKIQLASSSFGSSAKSSIIF